jgi:hypothetical protein
MEARSDSFGEVSTPIAAGAHSGENRPRACIPAPRAPGCKTVEALGRMRLPVGKGSPRVHPNANDSPSAERFERLVKAIVCPVERGVLSAVGPGQRVSWNGQYRSMEMSFPCSWQHVPPSLASHGCGRYPGRSSQPHVVSAPPTYTCRISP